MDMTKIKEKKYNKENTVKKDCKLLKIKARK